MVLFWLGLLVMCSVPLTVLVWLTYTFVWLCRNHLHLVPRIFQEKPLFIIPRGQPSDDAERVRFPGPDGLTLSGCYLKARGPRRGVILFGLEFGSDCWSCRPYCDHLVEAGFDVFAFESCGQGTSDARAGYEPLQWVTDHEVGDTRAALDYLKCRPDADPRGVGFFGISKGAGAGLNACADDPYVRCFATDGAFATYTTLVPYMRHWYRIYNSQFTLQGLVPSWYYGLIGLIALRQVEAQRRCRFPHLERAVRRLAPRPWLMIHGGDDAYIKPEMARTLFDRARPPKELWMVEGAKHNQALAVAGDEYRARVLAFFEEHLADRTILPPMVRGTAPPRAAAEVPGTPEPRTDAVARTS